MNSILDSVKALLGIVDDNSFDAELILHINSVFSILTQLGIGPPEGFYITNSSDTWNKFLGNAIDLELVKSYVYLRVRLLFDPPQNSFLVESIKKQCEEFEWRANVIVEG